MTAQNDPDALFERLAEYFQSSRFEYLALDYAGSSLRISRAPLAADGASQRAARLAPAIAPDTRGESVLASSVGVVERAPGRTRFPAAGERVAEGECLFAIRRYKNSIEVKAPTSGSLASLAVGEGAFVEFGQPLATICQPV